MTHGFRFRRWAVRLAAAGAVTLAVAGRSPAGEWPVPWPPPGTTNPSPGSSPPDTVPPPPGDTSSPPPGTGQPPDSPPPVVTPPGTGQPPPDNPPPGASTPEPASAVLGLSGVGAGLLAWRRRRAG